MTMEPSESRAPRPWLLIACVLVVVLASYIPVLGGPFIWDDHHLVEQSRLVKQLQPLPEYFGQGFWQHDDSPEAHTYYRPLVILSFAIDHLIYGDNSGGFHLTNLWLHLLATVFLFRLLRRRQVGAGAASLATALWALFPRLTEDVAWISGRTDVLASVFVLAALLVNSRESPRRRVYAALLLLLGLFCKEVAIAGVAAMLVQEWRRASTWRERAFRLWPPLLASAFYGALRWHAIGAQASASTQLHPYLRAAAAFAAIGRYLVMLATPWLADIQIGQLTRPSALFVVLGVVVTIAIGVFAFRCRRRTLSPDSAAFLVMSAVSIGLVLHLIPFSVNVVAADRFMYLPLAGLVLLVTPLVEQSSRARLFVLGASLLAASFAAVTFWRASVWSDEVALWSTAFKQKRLDPSIGAVEFGNVFTRAGLYPEALALFARGVDPAFDNYEIALNNIGTTSLRTGHYAEAAELFAQLSARVPSTPKYLMNLAVTETYLGNFPAARRYTDEAIARFPAYDLPRSLKQRLPELRRERASLAAEPPGTPPIEHARLLGRLGLAAESIQAWREALNAKAPTRDEMEEALWFAVQVGDADTVLAFHERYQKEFAGQLDPQLELVCETRAELVARLRAAWPTLGVPLLGPR